MSLSKLDLITYVVIVVLVFTVVAIISTGRIPVEEFLCSLAVSIILVLLENKRKRR